MLKRSLLLAGSGLLAGIVLGYGLSRLGPSESLPQGAEQSTDPAAGVVASALAELTQLREAHETLQREYDELAAAGDVERSTVPSTPEDRSGAAIVDPIADPLGKPPAVSFGTWAEEPALRTADWVDMGLRARDLVMARGAGIGGGQPAEMGALEKKAIRELGAHLARIEGRRKELAGHPVVVVNLMASHLQEAGKPLQPWQIESIETKGRDYERQAETLREELERSDALASERKLRSIQLRKGVVDAIVAEVLTREQWDVLFRKETKGLLYYDVYQVGGLELERPNSSVYWRNVREDALEHLQLFLLTEWELGREEVARLEGLLEQWIERIMALPKVPGHPSSALHIDEVLPCVEVHVEFQKKVMAALADPEAVQRVRTNTVYAVFPRLRGPR